MFKRLILFAGVVLIIAHAKSQTVTHLNLLPMPKNITLQSGSFQLSENFDVAIHSPVRDTILVKAVNRMYQTLNRRTGVYFKQARIRSGDNSETAALQVNVNKAATPAIGTDESYSLNISNSKVIVNAPTTIGALHAFETIVQLLTKNDTGGYYLPPVAIQDNPRFQWRGLMIDVSRHFIPVDVLKRNIEAMAAVKMNVLHLHLTDNEGFRVESKVFPQLHVKGSNGEYYKQAQIKELVAFAEEREIIIVPEFDMPGHTKSWFAGQPQLSSAVLPYEPGPPIDIRSLKDLNLNSIMRLMATAPFPAMDPSKETTYEFIDKFIAEMVTLFPSPFFHIGADENNGVVWKQNPSIVAFMEKNKIPDTHALQAYFVKRVGKIVSKHGKKMIGWEELFSNDISKDVVVQVWQNSTYTKKALDNGNPVIISKGFYLDLFMPAHVHYNNPDLPAQLPDSVAAQLRGGEAAQWTEAADKTNIETRIWPRAAAVAERLWSPASVSDVDDFYRRLFLISEQLDELGLQHVSGYERSLRRISNNDFTTLKTLTDVLTPVKGYKKLFAQMTKPENFSYQTTPLIQVSDIVPVESKVQWEFRAAVKSYLASKDSASEKIINDYITQWANNHEQIRSLIATSSQLKAVEKHSENLSVVAAIGIEALKKIKEGSSIDSTWLNEKLNILKTAGKPVAETELCIVREIEALVKQQLLPLPASYPSF